MKLQNKNSSKNLKFQAAENERQDIHYVVIARQEKQDEFKRKEILEDGFNSQEFQDDRGECQEKMEDENVDNLANQMATDSQIETPLTPPLSPF